MDKQLKIILSVDKKTGELQVVNNELKQTGHHASNANKQTNMLSSSIGRIGAAVGGLYAVKEAFEGVIGTGIAYNRMIENQINGIQSLIVATSSNASAQGHLLSLQQKYNLGNKEAIVTLKELEKINATTPHKLGQTAQIYKALYTNSKKYGASQEEMVKMTKLVSIAAGNAGIEFGQILASVDGLANGTYLANSEMGRFLSSIGLAPATLKELAKEGKSIEFILNGLKEFDRTADTFDIAVSNMENSWQQFTGKLSEPAFDAAKDGIIELTGFINELDPGSIQDFISYTSTGIGVLAAYKVGSIAASVATTAGTAAMTMYARATSQATFVVNSHGVATTRATIAQRAFNVALKANPIGLALGLAAAGYTAWSSYSDSVEKAEEKTAKLADTDKRLNQLNSAYEVILNNEHLSNEQKQRAIDLLNAQAMAAVGLKAESDKLVASTNGAADAMMELNKKFTPKDEYSKAVNEREDLLKQYGEYADARAFIEENFSKKIEQLNAKEIKSYKQTLESANRSNQSWLNNFYTTQSSSLSAWEKYYTALGDLQTAWAIKEAELYNEYRDIYSEEELKKFIETQRKSFFETNKLHDESAKEIAQIWDNLGSSMRDSFQKNLFDLLRGDFDSFKDYLKSFGKDIASDLITPASSLLSNSLANGGGSSFFNSLSKVNTSNLKDYGFEKQDGKYVGTANNVQGIVVDSAGQVLQGSKLISNDSSLSSALGYASSLKSLYSLATNGISSSIISSSQSIASGINSLGFTSAANSVGGFGYGFANPFTQGLATTGESAIAYGQAASGGLIFGAGGYLAGGIGDKLFNADTYASEAGAVAGLASGIAYGLADPITATIITLAGTLIGGMFGKTKQTGAGINLQTSAGFGDVDDIQSYKSFEKNSWFNDKSWDTFSPLDDLSKLQINKLFGTYEFLLDELRDNRDIFVEAGKYSQNILTQSAIPKAFISQAANLSKNFTDDVFNIWSDYAVSIDKTVEEALTQTVGGFIATQDRWKRDIVSFNDGDLQTYDINKAIEDAKKFITINESSLTPIYKRVSTEDETTVAKFADNERFMASKAIYEALDELDFEKFSKNSSELIEQFKFTPEQISTVTAMGEALKKITSLEADKAAQLKQYETSVSQNFNSVLNPDMLYANGKEWVDIGKSKEWALSVGMDGIENMLSKTKQILLDDPTLDKTGEIAKNVLSFANAGVQALEQFKSGLAGLSSTLQNDINSLDTFSLTLQDIHGVANNLVGVANKDFISVADGMRNDILKAYQNTITLHNTYDQLTKQERAANNTHYSSTDIEAQIKKIREAKVDGDIQSEINTFNGMFSDYQSTLSNQTNILRSIENSVSSLERYSNSLLLDENLTYLNSKERASMAKKEYTSALTSLNGAITSGDSDAISRYSGDVQEYAKSFLTAYKSITTNKSDYDFEAAKVTSQLKSIDGLEDAQKKHLTYSSNTTRYLSDVKKIMQEYDPVIASSLSDIKDITQTELKGVKDAVNQKELDPTISVTPTINFTPTIYLDGSAVTARVENNSVVTNNPTYTKSDYKDVWDSYLADGVQSNDVSNMLAQISTMSGGVNSAEYLLAYSTLNSYGYSKGGATPNIGINEIAGFVHGQEYIIPQWVMQKVPHIINYLEDTRLNGFKKGGYTSFNQSASFNVDDRSIALMQEQLEISRKDSNTLTSILRVMEDTRQLLEVQSA